MKKLILIILFICLACPALCHESRDEDSKKDKYYYQPDSDKIDKYYFDSNSDYNWKYKYETFKAPDKEVREERRDKKDRDYRWKTYDFDHVVKNKDKKDKKHKRGK